MSNMFPDLPEVGRLPVKSTILEGKALAYNAQTKTYLPFQVTVKRKRKHAATAEELPLHLFIFNIIFLNGHSVFEKTQRERRKLLESFSESYSSLALKSDGSTV